ncbi:MAG: starch-binding protein [Bacteroidales bacterium]|jgi:hypothetical protein|nr:starch-binding protein [Bacteroidales bacterium]
MKKVYFLGLVAALLAFTACEKNERKPEGNIRVVAPVLNMAQSSVWLRDTAGETFINKFLMRINWTEARFTYENGVPAGTVTLRYVLEADVNDFTNPVTVKQTQSLFADLFSENLITWFGGEPDTSRYVLLRVKAIYGFAANTSNTEDRLICEAVSNTLVLKVDPIKPVDPEDTVPEIPEVNIRFKQVTGNWANFFAYSWSTGAADNIEEFGGWPGKKLNTDGEGWYLLTIPGSRPIHIILNNGSGSQWDFIDDPTIDDAGDYEIDTDARTKNKL